jgi:ADP-ribose pyrophosphatase YjhB (NUDIX family)
MSTTHKAAYGGVVMDFAGRVLLRETTGDCGHCIWTFPIGKNESGESPIQTALREVVHQTGCMARILDTVPGEFVGDTFVNRYFLMEELDPGESMRFHDGESADVRWASHAEAIALISLTPDLKRKARDLAILDAAISVWMERLPSE